MSEKLTLVRLALRGERQELLSLFCEKANAARERAGREHKLNGVGPASIAQEAVAAAYHEAAGIIEKRIREDQP